MTGRFGKVGIGILVMVGLHVLVGWPMTVVGGLVVGSWMDKGGAAVGALCGAVSWGLLIAVASLRAPEETRRMLDALAGILGNLPRGTGVGIGLLLGSVLGLLGGALGQQGRRWILSRSATPTDT
jgi:hypothetical protein